MESKRRPKKSKLSELKISRPVTSMVLAEIISTQQLMKENIKRTKRLM